MDVCGSKNVGYVWVVGEKIVRVTASASVKYIRVCVRVFEAYMPVMPVRLHEPRL